MGRRSNIDIPVEDIREFCRRHYIRKLSFFGSVLRDDFGSESDIDVLVEFEKDRVPGLIRLAGLEIELSQIFGGRKVDINTPKCLSHYFRERVLSEAEAQYVRG